MHTYLLSSRDEVKSFVPRNRNSHQKVTDYVIEIRILSVGIYDGQNGGGETTSKKGDVMVFAYHTVSEVLSQCVSPEGDFANELEAWQGFLVYLRREAASRENLCQSQDIIDQLSLSVDAGVLGVARRSDPENQCIRVLRDFVKMESDRLLVRLAQEFVECHRDI